MPSLKRRMEKSRVSFSFVCMYIYPMCPFFWLLLWSGLSFFLSFFLSDGKLGEKRQQLLLVTSSSSSSSCVIRWQCERSTSRRGEDEPDGEKRDTSITSTEVEGGRRKERERARERMEVEGGCVCGGVGVTMVTALFFLNGFF